MQHNILHSYHRLSLALPTLAQNEQLCLTILRQLPGFLDVAIPAHSRLEFMVQYLADDDKAPDSNIPLYDLILNYLQLVSDVHFDDTLHMEMAVMIMSRIVNVHAEYNGQFMQTDEAEGMDAQIQSAANALFVVPQPFAGRESLHRGPIHRLL